MTGAQQPLLMLEPLHREPTLRGLLNEAQAARAIGVTVSELHAMTTAGLGPVGFALTPRVVRYAPADVAAWKGQRVR